jgi:hypothetical protein
MKMRNQEPSMRVVSQQSSCPWDVGDYRCRCRAWPAFEKSLAGLLAQLVNDYRRFLNVSQTKGNRYIQFAGQKDGGITAEAVSNKFLEAPERLSQAACGELVKLSWRRPGKRSPNFWKHVLPPAPIGELASLGVRTLRDVFEVLSPSQLNISRGLFQSMAVVEKARQLFQDAGLAFPAIPGELAVRLTELGPWLFSTRPLDASPYDLEHFLFEKPRQGGDYVVLSHSGHGVNSYAIHYYLVRGYLRMFLQLGWGGVYMDDEAAAGNIRNCFSMADRLVQEAAVVGKLKANQRLIVVASAFYGSFWTVLGQKPLEGGRGNPTAVLQEAVDWLTVYRAKAE